MKYVIEAEKVSRIYAKGKIAETIGVNEINLKVKEGEFLSIMGPSGCGKSTFLHLLGLLDKPTSGRILVDGIDTSKMSSNKLAGIRNHKIGFIFQQFNLVPRISVTDNVLLPTWLNKTIIKDPKKRAEELLETVGLKHRRTHKPNQLSGGERQRVAIARALINNPSVILADEPTGNLDSKTGKRIMELIIELNKKGKTIVLVTHDEYMTKDSDRIIYLKDGSIIKESRG